MKPTEQELYDIGKAAEEGGYGLKTDLWYAKAGRAAFEASCKIALAPLTAQERGTAGADYLAFDGGFHKDYREILQFTLKNFIANRLCALTEQPDPAVEAVDGLMKSWSWGYEDDHVKKLVAAVDQARSRK